MHGICLCAAAASAGCSVLAIERQERLILTSYCRALCCFALLVGASFGSGCNGSNPSAAIQGQAKPSAPSVAPKFHVRGDALQQQKVNTAPAPAAPKDMPSGKPSQKPDTVPSNRVERAPCSVPQSPPAEAYYIA